MFWKRWAQKPYLDKEQEQAVVKAIGQAEEGNRGEVQVHLEAQTGGKDALERAREVFHTLGMDRTRDGTGVLLYVATADHKVAVFAGPGIHGAGKEGFWQEVTDTVAARFSADDPVGGLVGALEKIGALLREAAPGEDDAGNELPNRVTTS